MTVRTTTTPAAFLLFFLLPLALFTSCGGEPPGSRADTAADIERAMEAWAAAYEAGDLDRTISFVTEDAVLVPPGEPVVAGAEAIEAWTGRMLEATDFLEVTVATGGVRVAGDWAVSHGSWAVRQVVEGDTVTDTTRNVVVWERQPDGSWKAAYDVWNLGGR